MRKLLFALTIIFSISAIACGNEEKGKSCANKEKKCCKAGAAEGKACCKGKTAAAAESTPAATTTDATATTPTNAAPAKTCCKKSGEKKCAGH